MKKISVLALCLALIAILPSCEKIVGKGPVVTENRTISPFQALMVSIPAEAYFTQSANYSVEISAQQNILDEIETVIINNELRIRFRHVNTNIRSHEGITVHVSAPDINSLAVDGSANLQVSPVTASSMRLLVSGSGSIRADQLDASTIDATISGSGNMKVNTGNSNDESTHISGSGFIDLAGVTVKNADAHISGSGTIKVNASKTLDVHISGSGTVYYYGTPAVTSSTSGSGSVVKL